MACRLRDKQARGKPIIIQSFGVDTIKVVIIYMKKLLDSDWLRAVQFKCNTSAKSVTSVQKV